MMSNRRHSFDGTGAKEEQINWSFPLMKMHEIKDCLNALAIQVTEAQLNDVSNNKTLYKEIMEYLAELCTGINKDEMNQPAFNGLSVLNNPELHEDSIPNLHSFRAISKMMLICGITDFSKCKLSSPTTLT
jgi:kinetochore protein Nuf2